MFDSETQLCTAFAEAASAAGWVVYPETSGCDLLLVAREDVRTRGCHPGDQIAVQAKLRANIDVLAQALPDLRASSGPSFTAVLVPKCTREFRTVAHRLGVLVIAATRFRKGPIVFDWVNDLTRLEYSVPLWTPDVEVWTDPGVKAPKSITPWKMSALRLCLVAMNQGYLLYSDFKAARVSMTVWRRKKWIKDSGLRIGKQTRYTLVDEKMPPHLLYPEVFASIRGNSR